MGISHTVNAKIPQNIKKCGNLTFTTYNHAMIAFDEIDKRLKSLGKDRSWLVEITGRSADGVRAALAPNAKPKSRSELLQKVLSDAIEREESTRYPQITLPDQLTLAPTASEFDLWCQTYKASASATMKDWAVNELNKAATEWKASQIQLLPSSPVTLEKQA